MCDKNSLRFEVWLLDHRGVAPVRVRRMAAFHFRFHAEAFIESITKHPGSYEVVDVTETNPT